MWKTTQMSLMQQGTTIAVGLPDGNFPHIFLGSVPMVTILPCNGHGTDIMPINMLIVALQKLTKKPSGSMQGGGKWLPWKQKL